MASLHSARPKCDQHKVNRLEASVPLNPKEVFRRLTPHRDLPGTTQLFDRERNLFFIHVIVTEKRSHPIRSLESHANDIAIALWLFSFGRNGLNFKQFRC